MSKIVFKGQAQRSVLKNYYHVGFKGGSDPDFLNAQKFLKRHLRKTIICTLEVAKPK